MLHQTFSWLDVPRVFVLIILECALSADNALILAAIIHPLSPKKRTKALWIGFSSAIFLRLAAIVSLAYFIQFFWIQLLGAVYLLYLAIAYRYKKRSSKGAFVEKPLWQVVMHIECIDLIFAIDSMIAALALVGAGYSSQTGISDKLWIVYLGGIIGLSLMRVAAKILSSLMDTFANLEKAAHYLIGWIAVKLGFQTLYHHLAKEPHEAALYTEITFWVVALAILLYALFPKRKP